MDVKRNTGLPYCIAMYQGAENGNDSDKPLCTALLCCHFLIVLVLQITTIFLTTFSLYTAPQNPEQTGKLVVN